VVREACPRREAGHVRVAARANAPGLACRDALTRREMNKACLEREERESRSRVLYGWDDPGYLRARDAGKDPRHGA
jgi:hypothetical protein